MMQNRSELIFAIATDCNATTTQSLQRTEKSEHSSVLTQL